VYLLVNFGGPRHSEEICPFLTELLCDRDVIRTRFPTWLHNWIFRRVAKKRTHKLQEDYALIGGKSPIYYDTETLAQLLSKRLSAPVLTFHRYLPATHIASLHAISRAKTLRVLPLFPQFSYATTGSIARLLSPGTNLEWIASYADHPAFIASHIRHIHTFLQDKPNPLLLFSAHGLPQSFVDTGDPYYSQCLASFHAIRAAFPDSEAHLTFQSKFGPGEWLKPYTDEFCNQLQTNKTVIIIPLSFTSDHIETLFEIEHLYVASLRRRGITAYRCPALNLEPYWIDALATIALGPTTKTTALFR
jgi:ferrochelatase